MNIRIQAIHFDATDQLEAFIQKKVAKLEQYFDGIISAEVSLKVVKPESAKNSIFISIVLLATNGLCSLINWGYRPIVSRSPASLSA